MDSLGSVSKRVKCIYKRYYEPKSGARFQSLYEVYYSMASRIEAVHPNIRIEIDHHSLSEMIRSYFLDVIRYKEYHLDPKLTDIESTEGVNHLSEAWSEKLHCSSKINVSKVAAYTVKWILRYKPISVLYTDAESINFNDVDSVPKKKTGDMLANVNEYYALHVAFLLLDIEASEVSDKTSDELIYCFRFRAFDESSYFMILSRNFLLR